MFKTDNSLRVFATDSIEASSVAEAATGDLIICDETNALHANAIAAGEYFKVGQKDADGDIRWSPLVKFSNVTSNKSKAYVLRTQQSVAIGFDGVSGSINALDSNRYTLRVNFKHDVEIFSQQSDLHFFEYVSDSSATQIEVANYFAQRLSGNKNLADGANGKISAEVISKAVVTGNLHSSAGSLSLTNGSKAAVVGGTPAFVVGDYVTVAADDVTARYKVAAISGVNITLAQAYQGDTAVIDHATAKYIAKATVDAADAGLKLAGLAQKFSVGLHADVVVAFDVTLDGFGSTAAPAVTALAKGIGHGREVAELEWFGVGANGASYRNNVMPGNQDLISLQPVASQNYNILSLDCALADPKYAVAGAGNGRCQIVIAGKDGASLSAVTTAFGVNGEAFD